MDRLLQELRQLAGIDERPVPISSTDARMVLHQYHEALISVREAGRHVEQALKAMHTGSDIVRNHLPLQKRYTQQDMALALHVRKQLTELEHNLLRSETSVQNFSNAQVPKKVWRLF